MADALDMDDTLDVLGIRLRLLCMRFRKRLERRTNRVSPFDDAFHRFDLGVGVGRRELDAVEMCRDLVEMPDAKDDDRFVLDYGSSYKGLSRGRGGHCGVIERWSPTVMEADNG